MEISRQLNIDSVTWLIVITDMQIYNEMIKWDRETQHVPFEEKKRRINVGAEAGAEKDEVKEKPSAKWNKGKCGRLRARPHLAKLSRKRA